MNRRRAAFSIVELLVVIAIIAVLAALLFPVFSATKAQALKTSWVESMRQTSLGSMLYMSDYDDRYMIARYLPDALADVERDRTWVQSVLPYMREFELFLCPADHTRDPSFGVFDADLVPGDSYARYYEASKRSNIGYNYVYMSPLVFDGEWQSQPRTTGAVADPERTILFGESAWDIVDGQPVGGGHYLIVPPCRFSGNGNTDSFGLPTLSGSDIYLPHLRWSDDGAIETDFQAGGMYPWFGEKVTLVMASGGIRTIRLREVSQGCDVAPNWQGLITDSAKYLWDMR